MSGDWGIAACQAWNADPVLTQDLAKSGWIKNDKGRGYKIIQVFRADCGADRVMHAKTTRWIRQGAGGHDSLPVVTQTLEARGCR